MALRIVLAGSTGRLGVAIAEAAAARDDVNIVNRFARPEPGEDREDELYDALSRADVLIDVSLPDATHAHARAAARAMKPVVNGVTELPRLAENALEILSHKVPVVRARNFSLAATLFETVVAEAAGALDKTYDAEIVEAHHAGKRDAPSGTALSLRDVVARARGLTGNSYQAPTDRRGRRQEGAIGMVSLRGGGLPGEHTVRLMGRHDEVVLTHRVWDREVFAAGALTAALWASRAEPGFYGMADVIGLDSKRIIPQVRLDDR